MLCFRHVSIAWYTISPVVICNVITRAGYAYPLPRDVDNCCSDRERERFWPRKTTTLFFLVVYVYESAQGRLRKYTIYLCAQHVQYPETRVCNTLVILSPRCFIFMHFNPENPAQTIATSRHAVPGGGGSPAGTWRPWCRDRAMRFASGCAPQYCSPSSRGSGSPLSFLVVIILNVFVAADCRRPLKRTRLRNTIRINTMYVRTYKHTITHRTASRVLQSNSTKTKMGGEHIIRIHSFLLLFYNWTRALFGSWYTSWRCVFNVRRSFFNTFLLPIDCVEK